MKRYEVVLTEDAERDLEEICDFVVGARSRASGNHLLDRLLKTAESLAMLPERGSHPKELLALGIREYRQVFFKPYRLIYRVLEDRVVVYLIVDGRRDLRSLLERRLFGA